MIKVFLHTYSIRPPVCKKERDPKQRAIKIVDVMPTLSEFCFFETTETTRKQTNQIKTRRKEET